MSGRVKKIVLMFGVIALMVISLACSKNPTDSGEGANAKVEFDGIWFGSFILQPEQQRHYTFALIDPQGESFWGIFDTTYLDFSIGLHGTLKSEKELIKGMLDVLTINGKTGNQVQIDSAKIVTTQFEGHDARGLVGKFTGNAEVFDGSGDLMLAANDSVYNLKSSLAAVAGSWSLVEEDGITTITIKNDGTITGGTNWGAKFSGQMELINSQKNLYRVKSFNITGADQPYDGSYHGLATILEQTLAITCIKNDGSFLWSDGFSKE